VKQQRPGVLSVRAVNQYRRRDVFSYLSLRYYLDNVAVCTDQWAKQVATALILGRTDRPYLKAHYFKETDEDGNAKHRELFMPGANEALAEAALLGVCAEHAVFKNPEYVFSYHLNSGDDRKGIFAPYFDGLYHRHRSITSACDSTPTAVVRYTDITQFYPSISTDLAHSVWQKYSTQAKLPAQMRDVGEKLLLDHAEVSRQNGSGVLTGPMLSHMVGNLVLRKLDDYCGRSLPVRYFRYVDDITLVGSGDAVSRAASGIRSRLADIGLTLHEDESPKTIEVTTSEWLTARDDYHESRRDISWASLIGNLKKYLILNPDGRDMLGQAFRESGIRIPVFDYSNAVFESSYLERMVYLAKRRLYRRKSENVTIKNLLAQARSLRARYRQEFLTIAEEVRLANPYQKKRRIPKLRYRAGRLVYLSTDETLTDLANVAREIPELHFHSHVMLAVATGNVDGVLSMGTNAAQATAQPLRAAGRTGNTSRIDPSAVDGQSLAVLIVNGVEVTRPDTARPVETSLMEFAQTGASISLMKQAEPFVREMACLHGITDAARHPEILESVFDRDEELAMDAIDQLQQYVSL
jgi:hypothetical protein